MKENLDSLKESLCNNGRPNQLDIKHIIYDVFFKRDNFKLTHSEMVILYFSPLIAIM
jgi:hypothetical protein